MINEIYKEDYMTRKKMYRKENTDTTGVQSRKEQDESLNESPSKCAALPKNR